jgi:hypothetical protein
MGLKLKVLIVDGLQALQEHLLLSKNIRVKFVTCGRANCRCKLGERHGPYYYLRKRIGNTYKDIYVKVGKKSSPVKYEAVGGSVVLHIKSLDDIPNYLKDYPTFLIRKRISNRPSEGP